MLNKNKTNNIDRDSVLHQYQCSFVAPVSSIETKASSDYYKTSSTNITGNEAKEFYENLVKDKSNDKNSKTTCDTTKCHVKVKEEEEEYNFGGNLIPADDTIVRQLVNNLLRASSSGNKNSVVRCIKNIKGYTDFNAILNGQDEFGWNALMCAAAEGHLHIVKYLLKEGCEYKNVTDNSGMDLFELCELKNQFGIYVYLLDNENKYNNCKTNSFNGSIKSSCQTSTSVDCSRNRKKTKMINKDSGETLLKCELCDSSFHQNERIQHESSVMHIFNDNKNVVKNIYGIPDTNIGFQMMLRSGWNSNVGLGLDGCGRRNPVKPVIKQNRHGLGMLKNDNKFCHKTQFSDKKKNLLESSQREKDKKWEMNMRRYMSSDF
ncbi:G patch domain and ankyrin repeat-containing protein 1 homolog [Hydra vulgaris]|uniref:G patch domain and ankyrin repeat-containing protein 1 homolog n=1 Tax=Hydra vulgaris TaxID=6087 RepID=UPI001F5EB798|nr:G patch domain and ankyrin repeat-containing protein 1 homolog [Hydra vulgaris]